ncbi:DUF222 domain-containing protein [Ammonicoccus fulvus]|uniref:DUF222 domain-containing protein n=1 Tax=Ammonicoccus fulvus TaxID=3138240 RepID=A0ABZ3FU18_9ACTN
MIEALERLDLPPDDDTLPPWWLEPADEWAPPELTPEQLEFWEAIRAMDDGPRSVQDEIDDAVENNEALLTAEVQWWRGRMTSAPLPTDQAALVDLLRCLEDLKSCAAALQARAAVALEGARRQEEADRGVRRAKRGVGLGVEVGLARRESPYRGSILLGVARSLVRELPCTLAALESGVLNEYRATLVAQETACLAPGDRAIVDAWFTAYLADHPGLGNNRLVDEVRRKVVEVDQDAVVRRRSKAAGGRRVSLQPLPDGMVRMTAILGLQEGVAAYAALIRAAAAARAGGFVGDPTRWSPQDDTQPEAVQGGLARKSGSKGRGALMADALVERLTGCSATAPCGIELMVVITDRALFGVDDEPGHVDGYGPVAASWVRDLVGQADPEQRIALRRLFKEPGRMVRMEANRRSMSPALRKLIRLRDQRCRMPWCDARIGHDDHVTDHAKGGESSYVNAQGLCEACNYAKSMPGWSASSTVEPERGHVVTVRTPTGHCYESTQPSGPGDK